MNTKHTPGPWRIDPCYSTDIQSGNGKLEIASTCGAVLSGGPSPSTSEQDANARLIAAAPELFESTEILSGFVSALCEHFGVEDDLLLTVTPKDGSPAHKVSLCDAIKGAIDALSKATGKEPA